MKFRKSKPAVQWSFSGMNDVIIKKKRENMADDNNINSISILIVFLK